MNNQYPGFDILDQLHELLLRTEWADIASRSTRPCLWVAGRIRAGIKTTDVDCQMRLKEIETELQNIDRAKREQASNRKQ